MKFGLLINKNWKLKIFKLKNMYILFHVNWHCLETLSDYLAWGFQNLNMRVVKPSKALKAEKLEATYFKFIRIETSFVNTADKTIKKMQLLNSFIKRQC